MRTTDVLVALSATILLVPSGVAGQGPTAKPKFEMTIPNIMRGPEHYGREPQQVRWSPDGQWIYFQWLPPSSDWRDQPKPYRVRATAVAKPERVGDEEMDRVAPLVANGVLSPDRSKKLTEVRGELWLVDMRSSTVRRLTETVTVEGGGRFSSDGLRVLFTRDGNAYSVELSTGAIKQLTDIRTPGDAAAVT